MRLVKPAQLDPNFESGECNFRVIDSKFFKKDDGQELLILDVEIFDKNSCQSEAVVFLNNDKKNAYKNKTFFESANILDLYDSETLRPQDLIKVECGCVAKVKDGKIYINKFIPLVEINPVSQNQDEF